MNKTLPKVSAILIVVLTALIAVASFLPIFTVHVDELQPQLNNFSYVKNEDGTVLIQPGVAFPVASNTDVSFSLSSLFSLLTNAEETGVILNVFLKEIDIESKRKGNSGFTGSSIQTLEAEIDKILDGYSGDVSKLKADLLDPDNDLAKSISAVYSIYFCFTEHMDSMDSMAKITNESDEKLSFMGNIGVLLLTFIPMITIFGSVIMPIACFVFALIMFVRGLIRVLSKKENRYDVYPNSFGIIFSVLALLMSFAASFGSRVSLNAYAVIVVIAFVLMGICRAVITVMSTNESELKLVLLRAIFPCIAIIFLAISIVSVSGNIPNPSMYIAESFASSTPILEAIDDYAFNYGIGLLINVILFGSMCGLIRELCAKLDFVPLMFGVGTGVWAIISLFFPTSVTIAVVGAFVAVGCGIANLIFSLVILKKFDTGEPDSTDSNNEVTNQ